MPLTASERVDGDGLRRLVRYLLGARVHGIFVNGTMGIFALLRDSDQIRAIEIVVDEVAGRVPVVAGVSDTGTVRVIERARLVDRMGVDAITTLPPFYYPMTDASITRFYRDVAAAVSTPLLLYNNPILGRVNISVAAVRALSEEPNIVGLKDSCADTARWRELVNAFSGRGDFTVLLGTELSAPVGLMLGADGIISGSHNVAPRIGVGIYEAVRRGDHAKALALGDVLARLYPIFDFGEIWGGFEAALQYLRIAEKATAAPYVPVTPDQRTRIVEILRSCDLEPWDTAPAPPSASAPCD